MSRTGRTWYLAGQGIAVLLWWAVISVSPAARELFLLLDAPQATLFAFVPGDLALLVFGSIWLAARWDDGPTPPLAWIVSGALWALTAYLLTLLALGAVGWAGPSMMAAASLGMALVVRGNE